MSDALTDIKQDRKNEKWIQDNLNPIIEKYEESEEQDIIKKLQTLKKQAPNRHGYMTDSPKHTIERVIKSIRNNEEIIL